MRIRGKLYTEAGSTAAPGTQCRPSASGIGGRAAIAIAMAATVSGCSLSSPYVRVPTGAQTAEFCNVSGCSIDRAIEYSTTVRESYRTVLDSYARLNSRTGATNIVLGTAALGYAAAKAHRDTFTIIGLTGASHYALSRWYDNPARAELFAQTHQALVCAEDATGRLRFPAGQAQMAIAVEGQIDASMKALRGQVAEVERLASILNSRWTRLSRDFTTNSPKTVQADYAAFAEVVPARIASARKIIDDVAGVQSAVDGAISSRMTRQNLADNAGYRLVSAVNRIVDATDREARKTIPNPDVSFAVVAGLTKDAARLIPSTEAMAAFSKAVGRFEPQSGVETAGVPGKAFRPLVVDMANLDAAVSGLRITLQELRGLVQRHAAAVGTAPTADMTTAIDKCGIAGLGGLSVSPAQVQAKTGSTTTFALDVRGGKVPYAGDFSGRVPGGVTLVQAESSGSRLTLVVSDKAEVGSFQVRVSDANGMLVTVPLEVTK